VQLLAAESYDARGMTGRFQQLFQPQREGLRLRPRVKFSQQLNKDAGEMAARPVAVCVLPPCRGTDAQLTNAIVPGPFGNTWNRTCRHGVGARVEEQQLRSAIEVVLGMERIEELDSVQKPCCKRRRPVRAQEIRESGASIAESVPA